MTTLHFIREPQGRRAPSGLALWSLGFRPFYLGAAAWAVFTGAWWGLQLAGAPLPALPGGSAGHAREMLFGVVQAVITGFLFTAARNWTGRPTPTGTALQALFATWLLARVLSLSAWPEAAAWAQAVFSFATAAALARVLIPARQPRNYGFVALPLLMGAASVVSTWHPEAAVDALALALDAVLVTVTVMAGRMVPGFTRNAVPHSRAQRRPVLERAVLVTVLALVLLRLAHAPAVLQATVALAAALTQAARWVAWDPFTTTRQPLLWVLHGACAWLPLHLLLRAAALLGLCPPALATHALTLGAIGGLVLGMMVRSGRGHTARPLDAGPWDVWAFAALQVAALIRVGGLLIWPASAALWFASSATAWVLAFGIYLVRETPALLRPRLDGLPG